MYPHRIRLRGPWDCEPLRRNDSSDASLPPTRRVAVPCRWADAGLADFAGRVRFRRRFGYPGRIDADERVWLTCAGLRDTADVWLNGTLLGERLSAPFEFDATALLRARNELVMELEGIPDTGGIWGEVALEVRCTAFLRNVAVRPVGDIFEVTGEVVGVSESPLELYILLDHRQAGYAVLAPAPTGRPFRLVVGCPDGVIDPKSVQVDLVNTATVWYTVLLALGDAAATTATA